MGGGGAADAAAHGSVRDFFCGAFLHRHASGYLWDAFASGLVLVTNLFLMIALLRLATIRAGCDGDDDCSGTIYGGLRPSSFLTAVVTCGQLGAAFCMPLLGAIVDYTTWTRPLGAATAWAMCVVTVAQGLLLPRLLPVALLQIASLAAYVSHQVVALSYLPTLSRTATGDDAHERHRVNSLTVMATFGAEVLAILATAAIAVAFGLGVLDTARLSQLSSGAGMALVYARYWHGADGRALAAVPAKKRPEIRPLWRQGCRDVVASYAFLSEHHANAAHFLKGYAVANAAMTGFGSLCIVFMNDHLDLSPLASIAVVLVVLVVSLPAAALTTPWMDRVGANVAFFRIVAFMGCATMTAPVVLRGPKYAHFIFLYGILWGAAFGSYYAANTALFSTLVPVGSEAKFMSLYYFSAQVLSWAPPALYAIINQFLNDQSSALFILGAFSLASLTFFRRIDVDDRGPGGGATAKRDAGARHEEVQLAETRLRDDDDDDVEAV